MAVKSSFRLTKGGWVFLLVCMLMALGAFNASLNMTYLLASLLIAVFGLSVAAPLWTVRGLECRRSLPDTPFAGEPFAVNFHVSSRRRTPAYLVTVEDPLCEAANGRCAGGLIFRVPPRGRVTLAAAAAPQRRGALHLPGLAWSSRFPFGVAERRRQREVEEEVVIFPARGQLSRAAAMALRPSGARTGSPSRMGLPSEEFRSVREYKAGDNPRWIHWRATAHHGTLYVREMDRERSAPILIILDARLPAGLPDADRTQAEEALELAVSFAAEVCRVADAEGNDVTLVGFFPEPRRLHLDERSANDNAGSRVASSPGAMAPASQSRLWPFYEALGRLTPTAASDAEALRSLAEESGLNRAWQVIAVTPTEATRPGLQRILQGVPAQIPVASAPSFHNTFRLAAAGREARA